jgi:hypothetical protein
MSLIAAQKEVKTSVSKAKKEKGVHDRNNKSSACVHARVIHMATCATRAVEATIAMEMSMIFCSFLSATHLIKWTVNLTKRRQCTKHLVPADHKRF